MPPILAMLVRAPFETRHPSGRTAPFPEPPFTGGLAPPRRPLTFALLRILADPLSHDLTVSPDELDADTLVIFG